MAKQIESPCPEHQPKAPRDCAPAEPTPWWNIGNEYGGSLIEAGRAGFDHVSQRASETADGASDLLWSQVELATRTARSGAESLHEGAKAVGDTATQGVEAAGDFAWQGLDTARDTATQGVEAAGDLAWQGVDTARNTATQGVQAAGDLASQGVDTARDTAWQGVEAAGEFAEDGVKTGLGVLSVGADVLLTMDSMRRHAIADDPATKAAVRWAARDIPSQDIIYEQLAHNLAYGRGDAGQLESWGYGTPLVEIPLDPITGMYAVSVHPLPDLTPEDKVEYKRRFGQELTSVLCFRGSADAVDWMDDVQPEAVGAIQFTAHRADIARSLGRCQSASPPDTTGHSLGGALAQMAATLGAVRRVVTFQAPGIPAAMFDALPEDFNVRATHHRAVNDPVAWAGSRHLDGDVHVHETTQFDAVPMASHTHFLMGGLNDLRGGEVPNIADGTVFNAPAFVTRDEAGSMDETPDSYAPIPAILSGLHQEKMQNYQERNGQGKTSRTTGIRGAAPDWDGDGQTGWLEGGFHSARTWAAEGVRVGAGHAFNTSDQAAEAASDYTGEHIPGGGEVFSEAVNAMTTQGDSMGVRGAELQRFMKASRMYDERLKEGMRLQKEQGVPFDFAAMESEILDGPELGLSDDLRQMLVNNLDWQYPS